MATASAILLPLRSLGKICRLTEAGVAELEPVRVARPVADDVGAVLAARVLLADVARARRRRDDVRRRAASPPARGPWAACRGTARRSSRYSRISFDAHLVPVEHVAVLAGAHLEVELRVHRVRPRAAQVVGHARGARVGAGDARSRPRPAGVMTPLPMQRCRKMALSSTSASYSCDHLGQARQEVAALLDPAVGQVVAHAAEAEVVEHHARAAEPPRAGRGSARGRGTCRRPWPCRAAPGRR